MGEEIKKIEFRVPESNNVNSGKFIQVYANNKPYMRFFNEKTLHGEMLEDLLSDLKIKFNLKYFGDDYLPEPNGQDYTLVGAGDFIDTKQNKILLRNKSYSYRIKPNKEHAEEISKLTKLVFDVEG